jgi:hypothetical protein
MATQKQYVAVWKSGQHLKWRGLSMREYTKFSRMLDLEPEMQVYCDLYELVVDHDECPPIERVPAGIVDFLGRTLLKSNAFSGDAGLIAKILTKRRAALQTDYFENAKAIIAGLFRYTFEELDNLDEESFFDMLAKAELLSGEKFDPVPIGTQNDVSPKRPKKPLTQTQAKAFERTVRSRQY